MRKDEQAIWIDMTDLSIWHGHFTGIQRVVYNLASRYAKTSKNVNFFTFNADTKGFELFDFQGFEGGLNSQSTSTGETELSTRQRIKLTLKEAYLKSPNSVKKVLHSSRVKGLVKGSLRYYQKTRSFGKNVKNRKHGIGIRADFGVGDTILILGNSWDRPDLVPTLSVLRDKKELKIYQVIYDLIPVYQPQAFNAELFKVYSRNMFEIVTNSDGLFAISESSMRDTKRFCRDMGVACPPIDVIRLGDDIPVSKHPVRPLGLPHNEKFLLCVGTIEARKNHTILYYAWKEGLRRGVDMPHLVIVGRQGWYTGDIIHTINTDPDTRDRFHFMQNTNDDELVWLYQNALFTVYPSYYEGWGLPVAESAAMGKLCITSDQSSMPEIAGPLMDYFSPFNTDDLTKKIIYYMDELPRAAKEREIKQGYIIKNWDECFEQVNRFIIKRNSRRGTA